MTTSRRIKKAWLFLVRLQREMGYDDCMGMAAQIAYYLLLSLFPFLLFLISLISFLPILEADAVLAQLREALPGEAYDLVAGTVFQILSAREGGILGVGLLASLWAASMGVGAIITTINRAYNIHPKRNIAVQKVLSIILTAPLGAWAISLVGNRVLEPYEEPVGDEAA